MMNLTSDFRTRTALGLTNCNHSLGILRDYRDVANVDTAIDYVKKVFAKNNFDPCVTFACHRTIGRIFEDWKDGKKGYTFIRFGETSDTTFWREKLTTTDIKLFYMNCADNAIDFEKIA